MAATRSRAAARAFPVTVRRRSAVNCNECGGPVFYDPPPPGPAPVPGPASVALTAHYNDKHAPEA